jgi:hypothetical protein
VLRLLLHLIFLHHRVDTLLNLKSLEWVLWNIYSFALCAAAFVVWLRGNLMDKGNVEMHFVELMQKCRASISSCQISIWDVQFGYRAAEFLLFNFYVSHFD